ncbi:MAG: chemotaxis protein CheY-P-specific phosphatase CheC [Cyclobacteriaceae bacterium]|jgi:chemotaxis protein CheY-P-specific phosphatase CheC
MLENLNHAEMEVATKLIFDGLSMAKSTMEQILQSPITLEKVDYGAAKEYNNLFTKSCDHVHSIKTELIGEMKGVSYLIFSEEEVSSIYQACLPGSIVDNDSPESEMMKLGFLTEIDNMVAAAVITEFANFLNLEIYGHVPSLKVGNSEEIQAYLTEESKNFDSIIHFKAIFQGTEIDISPDFIWVFQNEFTDKIKSVI